MVLALLSALVAQLARQHKVPHPFVGKLPTMGRIPLLLALQSFNTRR
jgi:hypothetical protein